MAKYNNLDDLLPPELLDGQARPIEDYLDIPVVIHSARITKGFHGDYARLVVSLPDNEEQFFLATGAAQPFEAVCYLKENNLFPVLAKFERAGRAYVLKSA